MESITRSLETIATFFDYIMHPLKILIGLWTLIVKLSLPVCLIGALACIILYSMGFKKYGKYITLSMVIYVLIQAINAGVKSGL